MAEVAIAEEDLNTFKKGMALLQALNGKPDARKHLEAGLKVLDPNLRTTEEQAAEVLAPVLTKVETQLAALTARQEADDAARAKRDEEAAHATMIASFSALRRDEGLTDEGEEKVKALMVDRNIADPAAAFALFQKQNPAVEVTTASYEPSHWNYEKNAVETDVAGLWADPEKWANEEAGRILTDMRKAPIPG